jgi:hypothetical protein
MIRHRRLLIALGLCACAVLTSAVVAWLLWPSTAITHENAARITTDMTLGEVEAILDGPARNESTGPLVMEWDDPENQAAAWRQSELLLESFLRAGAAGQPIRQWQSDYATVIVRFDDAGKVRECHALRTRRHRDSLLGMLRSWLGL